LDFVVLPNKKQIIFTCDQPPTNIKSLENRLKTRFAQGLNLSLTPPELEMRAAILLKKSENKAINIHFSADIALYIASNITSNVRDLEGFIYKQLNEYHLPIINQQTDNKI
jgi:chromosomal replication initiator protein